MEPKEEKADINGKEDGEEKTDVCKERMTDGIDAVTEAYKQHADYGGDVSSRNQPYCKVL